MFTELALEYFRGFSKLRLEGLQRVNLVVGRNNSGKTSLLEAITTVSDPRRVASMSGLLRAKSGQDAQRYFRWLLNDKMQGETASIAADSEKLHLKVWMRDRNNKTPNPGPDTLGNFGNLVVSTPNNQPKISCRVISVQLDSPDALVKLFGAAVKRRGGEERIEGLLKSVDERIQKVRIEPADDGIHIMADLGLSEMTPLSQVGQGIIRLIAIFSEIIGEQPQICLIDEIENGIHHSMLEQVWTGIATASESLDVQIFATTHSQECIEAAHRAFSKRQTYDLSIIQLFRIESGVQGRVLNYERINAAMAGEIDLR